MKNDIVLLFMAYNVQYVHWLQCITVNRVKNSYLLAIYLVYVPIQKIIRSRKRRERKTECMFLLWDGWYDELLDYLSSLHSSAYFYFIKKYGRRFFYLQWIQHRMIMHIFFSCIFLLVLNFVNRCTQVEIEETPTHPFF